MNEGLLCAVALAFGMFICTRLLDLSPATEGQAPLWLPFVVASALGFACGSIAPYLYRRACHNKSEGHTTLDLGNASGQALSEQAGTSA